MHTPLDKMAKTPKPDGIDGLASRSTREGRVRRQRMAITQTRTIDTSELFEGPRQTRRPNVRGRRGAISAGHHLAALAGQRILDRGGNAIDAGVTAGICIGLLLPDLVNVGGVAPIILHHVSSGDTQTISGVGRWPKAANVDSRPRPEDRQHGARPAPVRHAGRDGLVAAGARQVRDDVAGRDPGRPDRPVRERLRDVRPAGDGGGRQGRRSSASGPGRRRCSCGTASRWASASW